MTSEIATAIATALEIANTNDSKVAAAALRRSLAKKQQTSVDSKDMNLVTN